MSNTLYPSGFSSNQTDVAHLNTKDSALKFKVQQFSKCGYLGVFHNTHEDKISINSLKIAIGEYNTSKSVEKMKFRLFYTILGTDKPLFVDTTTSNMLKGEHDVPLIQDDTKPLDYVTCTIDEDLIIPKNTYFALGVMCLSNYPKRYLYIGSYLYPEILRNMYYTYYSELYQATWTLVGHEADLSNKKYQSLDATIDYDIILSAPIDESKEYMFNQGDELIIRLNVTDMSKVTVESNNAYIRVTKSSDNDIPDIYVTSDYTADDIEGVISLTYGSSPKQYKITVKAIAPKILRVTLPESTVILRPTELAYINIETSGNAKNLRCELIPSNSTDLPTDINLFTLEQDESSGKWFIKALNRTDDNMEAVTAKIKVTCEGGANKISDDVIQFEHWSQNDLGFLVVPLVDANSEERNRYNVNTVCKIYVGENPFVSCMNISRGETFNLEIAVARIRDGNITTYGAIKLGDRYTFSKDELDSFADGDKLQAYFTCDTQIVSQSYTVVRTRIGPASVEWWDFTYPMAWVAYPKMKTLYDPLDSATANNLANGALKVVGATVNALAPLASQLTNTGMDFIGSALIAIGEGFMLAVDGDDKSDFDRPDITDDEKQKLDDNTDDTLIITLLFGVGGAIIYALGKGLTALRTLIFDSGLGDLLFDAAGDLFEFGTALVIEMNQKTNAIFSNKDYAMPIEITSVTSKEIRANLPAYPFLLNIIPYAKNGFFSEHTSAVVEVLCPRNIQVKFERKFNNKLGTRSRTITVGGDDTGISSSTKQKNKLFKFIGDRKSVSYKVPTGICAVYMPKLAEPISITLPKVFSKFAEAWYSFVADINYIFGWLLRLIRELFTKGVPTTAFTRADIKSAGTYTVDEIKAISMVCQMKVKYTGSTETLNMYIRLMHKPFTNQNVGNGSIPENNIYVPNLRGRKIVDTIDNANNMIAFSDTLLYNYGFTDEIANNLYQLDVNTMNDIMNTEETDPDYEIPDASANVVKWTGTDADGTSPCIYAKNFSNYMRGELLHTKAFYDYLTFLLSNILTTQYKDVASDDGKTLLEELLNNISESKVRFNLIPDTYVMADDTQLKMSNGKNNPYYDDQDYTLKNKNVEFPATAAPIFEVIRVIKILLGVKDPTD